MMNYLYQSQNWAKSCLVSALFLLALLFSSMHNLGLAVFFIWLQVPIYLIHEFEEHVFPGGFKEFVNNKVFKSPIANLPLDDRSIFWINIPFIWIMFPVCAILAQHYCLSLGAIPTYFALFNATLHILGLVIKRAYNPGCVVSLVLNYPLGIYTLYVMHQAGALSWQVSAYSILFAFLGHLSVVVFAVRRYKRGLKARAS